MYEIKPLEWRQGAANDRMVRMHAESAFGLYEMCIFPLIGETWAYDWESREGVQVATKEEGMQLCAGHYHRSMERFLIIVTE